MLASRIAGRLSFIGAGGSCCSVVSVHSFLYASFLVGLFSLAYSRPFARWVRTDHFGCGCESDDGVGVHSGADAVIRACPVGVGLAVIVLGNTACVTCCNERLSRFSSVFLCYRGYHGRTVRVIGLVKRTADPKAALAVNTMFVSTYLNSWNEFELHCNGKDASGMVTEAGATVQACPVGSGSGRRALFNASCCLGVS